MDLIRLHKYDVVYVHLWVTPIGPPIFERLVRWRSKRLIYDIDDMIFLGHHSEANRLFRFLKGRKKMIHLMKNSDHVITCTPKLDEFVRQYNSSTTDISSTIDMSMYVAKENKKIEDEEIVLGWSGSHSTSKYLHLLDEVIIDLSKRYKIKLKVIGDPLFSIPGVNVEAIAWSEASEVKELKSFDIGLYPLPDEEWVYGKSGLKALQYMALGIPTVATAIGANFRVIEDGVSGSLVPPDDLNAWVNSIELIIKDKERFKKYSLQGQDKVESQYSLNANLNHYIQALDYEVDVSILIPSLDRGGAEKIVSMTMAHLVKDKNVELLLLENTIHQTIPKNIKVRYVSKNDKGTGFFKLFGILKSSIAYRKYINRVKPKVSISFLNRPNFINVLATYKNKNVLSVINERSYPPSAYDAPGLTNALTKFLIRVLYFRADLIICNSELSANYFRKTFNNYDVKVKVWYNPINLGEIGLPRNGIESKKSIRILNIGRLDENKNQELIIKAFAQINNKNFFSRSCRKGVS